MGLFESLPDAPLKRSQIESLERMDAVDGTHTIYSNSKPDTAYGIVILLNGTLRAWAYLREREEWVELEQAAVDAEDVTDPEDSELVAAFHDEIIAAIGATPV